MKKLLIMTTIATLSLASCNKANDEVEVVDSPVENIQLKTSEDLFSLLEKDFNNLKEKEVFVGSIISGYPVTQIINIDNYPQDDEPVVGTDKEFPNTWGGIRKAVKYAIGIMEEGGCIKAWMDGDTINIEEVPC